MDIFDFNNHHIRTSSFLLSPEAFSYLGRRGRGGDGNQMRTRRVYYHRVRRGDNLSSISDRYGVPVATIKRLNGLGRSNNLQAGKRLRIR
jgi:hypothetical protein